MGPLRGPTEDLSPARPAGTLPVHASKADKMTDPSPNPNDDLKKDLDPLTLAHAKIAELEGKIKSLEDQYSASTKQFTEVLASNQKLLALASAKLPAGEPPKTETSESDYEDLIKSF